MSNFLSCLQITLLVGVIIGIVSGRPVDLIMYAVGILVLVELFAKEKQPRYMYLTQLTLLSAIATLVFLM